MNRIALFCRKKGCGVTVVGALQDMSLAVGSGLERETSGINYNTLMNRFIV